MSGAEALRIGARALLAGAAIVITTACGGSSPTTPRPPPPPPPPPTIAFVSDDESLTADAIVLEMSATGTDAFQLRLDAVELTDLFGYALDIVFDPTIVDLATSSFGGFLDGEGVTVLREIVEGPEGTLVIAHTRVAAAPGVSGSGTLMIFDFTAVGSGTSTIVIQNSGAVDGTGAALTVDFVGGLVIVPDD